MTQFATVMMIVWGLLVLIAAAVYLYRSRLQRDEVDQIVLDESLEHEKQAQAVIAAKVGKVEPILLICKWVVAVATVLVIAYWIWNIYSQFQ